MSVEAIKEQQDTSLLLLEELAELVRDRVSGDFGLTQTQQVDTLSMDAHTWTRTHACAQKHSQTRSHCTQSTRTMVALNSGRSLLSSHDRDAASEREQEKETDILRAQLALAEERAKALEEQIEREKEREERASERERERDKECESLRAQLALADERANAIKVQMEREKAMEEERGRGRESEREKESERLAAQLSVAEQCARAIEDQIDRMKKMEEERGRERQGESEREKVTGILQAQLANAGHRLTPTHLSELHAEGGAEKSVDMWREAAEVEKAQLDERVEEWAKRLFAREAENQRLKLLLTENEVRVFGSNYLLCRMLCFA